MSTIENETQNGTARNNDPKDIADLNWKEWHKFPISELVPKTFDDHSRIHDPKKSAEIFADFGTALEKWLENFRAGKKLSRTVAIEMTRLRRAVTDLNGDPMWGVKGTTAWKVIYENRIAPFYASLEMSDDEIAALATAIKGYIRDRRILTAVIAEHCVYSVQGLADTEWVIAPNEKYTVKDAVEILLGDDQSAASKFEGPKMPDALVKAIDAERKRQKVLTGAKAGNQKQGFEKKWTYFGPEKVVKSNPSPQNPDDPTSPGNVGQDTAKKHADSLRELVRDGSISVHAYVMFIREQTAELNAILLKAKVPKGGNVPGIVEMLDAEAKECKLLADYKRPGDGQKPERDAVSKAAIEIATK
jgi:hypothetical protein